MRKDNDDNIINDRGIRDRCAEHYEVLEKVKGLFLIPNTQWATLKQVQIAIFRGQQGRISRPDRAILNGQF